MVGYNSQESPKENNYRIQYETDNRANFRLVEEVIRLEIDHRQAELEKLLDYILILSREGTSPSEKAYGSLEKKFINSSLR